MTEYRLLWFGSDWVVAGKCPLVDFLPNPMRSAGIRRSHRFEKPGDDEVPGGRGSQYDPGLKVPRVGEASSVPHGRKGQDPSGLGVPGLRPPTQAEEIARVLATWRRWGSASDRREGQSVVSM